MEGTMKKLLIAFMLTLFCFSSFSVHAKDFWQTLRNGDNKKASGLTDTWEKQTPPTNN